MKTQSTITKPITNEIGSLEYRIDMIQDDLKQIRHRTANPPTVRWKDIIFKQTIKYKMINDNRKDIHDHSKCSLMNKTHMANIYKRKTQ